MDLNTVHNGDIWGTRDVTAIGALEQDKACVNNSIGS